MATPQLTARVAIPEPDTVVLFLIAQYLRDLGLHTTVVALLRESGVDPFWLCGPSREIALLRELILQGEWRQVRALLEPLREAVGDESYHVAAAVVEKQSLLEEFFSTTVEFARRRVILQEVRHHEMLHGVKLSQQELQWCSRVLKGELNDGSLPWTLDDTRLQCFETLVPLFRGEIASDDEESKYERMPRRQLVALLYDALLLHQQRDHGDADAMDMVSVRPISSPVPNTETGREGDSPLQLVLATIRQASETNPMAQSMNFSNVSTHEPAVSSSPSSSRQTSTAKTNPLVMSTVFRRHAPQRKRSQSPVAPMIDRDSTQLTAATPGTSVLEDASTQTDQVETFLQTPVAGEREVAVQTEAEPRRSSLDTPPIPVLPLQTEPTPLPPAPLRASITLQPADPPVEAWCSSRQIQLPAPAPLPTPVLQQSHASIQSNDDDKTAPYEPEAQDEDDAMDPTDDVEASDDVAPLRSYSELTLDSVVRAHVIAEVKEPQAIRAMDISPDGSEMVIGTNARALRVFDLVEPLATNTLASNLASSPHHSILPLLPVTMEKHKHHSSPIYVANYNHCEPVLSASLIATGSAESSIKVISRSTQQEQWICGHSGKCRALQFVSPRLLCSAASGDLVIRCWDLEASKPLCVQRFDGHVGEIQALVMATSPSDWPIDKRGFASSSMDRTVRLWDLRNAHCARVLARTPTPAFALAFSPSGGASNLLASAHQDGSVVLWDLRMAKESRPLASVTHHQDECRVISWSPDGRWLLSASFDGTLCILEATGSSAEPLVPVASFHQHDDKVLQAQWHPTQPAIVTTGADKLVKLWGFS